MAITFPDSWSETALVSIAKSGAASLTFHTMIETIDIDEGDKDVEYIASVTGGRIRKKIPQAETVITFEGYPVGNTPANTNQATGLDQYFYGDATAVSEPFSVTSSRARLRFRVAITWTDDTSATTGDGSTAASTNSFRWYCINADLVSMKRSFTDGILKCTFKFKVAPFNKAGTGNIVSIEAENTALSALTTYTAS
jgi:hypothetical protein